MRRKLTQIIKRFPKVRRMLTINPYFRRELMSRNELMWNQNIARGQIWQLEWMNF